MLDHSTGFDRRHSIDASAFVLSSRPPSVMTRICEHAVDPSHKPFCPLRGGGDQRPGSRTRPAVVEILCCLKMARDQNAGRSSRARGPNGIPWSDSSLDDDLQSVPVGPPAYSKVIRFLFADSLTAGQVLCNGSILRLPKPARLRQIAGRDTGMEAGRREFRPRAHCYNACPRGKPCRICGV